jgi:hypothetical protein
MIPQLSPGMVRLVALGVGAVMLVIITVFHGTGLHHVVRHYKRCEKRILARRPHPFSVSLAFGIAVFWMLSLHIVEIAFWAVGLWKLGLVPNFGDSFYFTANSYTTLGYGKVAVAEEWRAICPVIAISGLFTFAWTASTLVDVVTSNHNLHDQIEEELGKETQMRAKQRTEARGLREKESVQERALRGKGKQDAAGKSFRERYELWKEMGREIEDLRAAEEAQIEQLRRTERDAEKHLGDPPATEDSTKEG